MLTEHLDREPIARKNRAFAVAGALVVATLLAGLSGLAQSFSTLSGSVLDQRGGIIPKGTVTLASQDADRKYEVRADASGQYQFVGVVPGDYVLSAQIPGFKDGSTKLTIAGANVRRDLSLPVGALQETITVISRARDGFVPVERVTRDETAKPTSCDDTIPSGRIKPPLKLKDVRPVYPENVAAANGGGVVLLDAQIGTDGAVKEATSKDPSVHPDLAAAAIAAVRQWRFTPTLLNCIPVEVEMAVRVNFKAE